MCFQTGVVISHQPVLPAWPLCPSPADTTGCPVLAPHLHSPQGFCYSQFSLAWDHSEIILTRLNGLRSSTGQGSWLHDIHVTLSSEPRSSQVGSAGSQQGSQHCHWQQGQKASFFSWQVKPQLYETQAEHFTSVPSKAKRGKCWEQQFCWLPCLVLFSNICSLAVLVQHCLSMNLLNECKFHQEFLRCVCQRID